MNKIIIISIFMFESSTSYWQLTWNDEFDGQSLDHDKWKIHSDSDHICSGHYK